MLGITLGRRQTGSPTDAAVKKLIIYYGRAILDSDIVESMKKALWTTLHHCCSTDDNPRHQFCPQGEDSLCFYENALACKEFPGDHKNHVHLKLDFDHLHPITSQYMTDC
ncbi:hypothetical protein ElyMa_004775400 [Elysia marginata]|uniref:Uncharacterized protein n=1 Tax=Elysia marginata TaxID=1093978 RepID=A0AAV4IL23_9GAST|nr:hypothetical protein ElyMa_004775400 [Elysia marginata]